jgi:hypothetical protein
VAGFGDLPVGDNTAFASAPAPQATAPSGGGGILGFLYNHLVAPTASEVGGAISDIPKIGQSAIDLGKIGAGLATHNNKAATNALNDANKVATSSHFFNSGGIQAEKNAVANGKNFGSTLEAGLGGGGNQVLNLLAPVAGGESLAGTAGFDAIKAGAGLGAKIGAASGVSNAAAQGGTGEQLFSSGVTGGLLGGATGAFGSGAGLGLGKLAGKLGNTSETTAAPTNNGIFSKSAANAGMRAAQVDKAQQAIDFPADTKAQVAAATSHDKGANPVGFNQVSDFVRGLNMPADAQHMENTSNFLGGAIGGNLKDITNNIPAQIDNPVNTATAAIKENTGTLGNLSRNGSGAAASTLKTVTNATSGIQNGSSVSDVLGAISKLEQAKAGIGQSVAMGHPVASGQQAVYQRVIDSLHAGLNSTGVNKAVADFKVSPELENAIKLDATDNQVSPEAAQHVIDTLNNAKSYGDLRSAMQPGVVAGKLAKIAKDTAAARIPEAGGKANPGIPSWELATSLHNPAYLAAAAAKMAGKSNIVDSTLAKVNPGAFEAGKTTAMAADEATAQKLAMPGGAPATAPTLPPTAQGAAGVTSPLQPPAPPGAIGTLTNPASVQATAGAATGQAASQEGQALSAPNPNQGQPQNLDVSGLTQGVNNAASAADSTQPTLDASSIPGGTLQDLQAEVQADPKNASIYEQIYSDAQKQVAASAPPKLNATEAKNLTNIQNATDALNNYVSGLNSLSSSTRGAGVGTLTALLGKVGLGGTNATTAARLESSKEELAIQLAQAMNNGTKPQGAQIEQIKAMLPSISDPKALAMQKIEQLSQNLSAYLGTAANASVANRGSGTASSILGSLAGGQ